MCDDLTERDNQKRLAERRLGRREFGALGAGATVAALIPGCGGSSDPARAEPNEGTKDPATSVATKSGKIGIETPDGTVDSFLVWPESGKHPAIIMWPDILGPREAFETMARRLAEHGYCVLVVNQYYRTAKAPVLKSWDEWRSEEGRAKLQPMLAAITPAGVASDSAAFVAWLDLQSFVDKDRKIGACGYCMGGPFTFRTAASSPTRVGAIASLHGGGLVTSAPDSPHLLLPEMEASLLIAIAQNDDERDPDVKNKLRDAAKEAGREAEIEVYPAQHGWCAIDSAAYDEAEADRANERMLELFSKL